jgi:hypothetical protein
MLFKTNNKHTVIGITNGELATNVDNTHLQEEFMRIYYANSF